MGDQLNEHKAKQLRELALINGTLREGEPSALDRDAGDLYQLPESVRSRMDAQYARDVAAQHPGDEEAGKMDQEYRSFIAELGGEAPQVTTTLIRDSQFPEWRGSAAGDGHAH